MRWTISPAVCSSSRSIRRSAGARWASRTATSPNSSRSRNGCGTTRARSSHRSIPVTIISICQRRPGSPIWRRSATASCGRRRWSAPAASCRMRGRSAKFISWSTPTVRPSRCTASSSSTAVRRRSSFAAATPCRCATTRKQCSSTASRATRTISRACSVRVASCGKAMWCRRTSATFISSGRATTSCRATSCSGTCAPAVPGQPVPAITRWPTCAASTRPRAPPSSASSSRPSR